MRILVFWLLLVSRVWAVDQNRIDAAVEASMRAWGVPGVSIAVVKDDKVVLVKGYGVKELGKNEAITPATQFAIGSTTKAFTTTAMAILIDDGKMDWDDPVRKHIPFFHLSDPLADQMVTLRDLVCHRTGLTRHDVLWHGTNLSREDLLRRAAFLPLSKPFRTTYQYQNIMFLAAGYAVGLTAGMSWEDFVQRRILDPLGMKNTNFSTSDAERAADHATPHAKARDGNARAIRWRNIDNIAPAGSINSSASDIARWMRFHLNEGTLDGKRVVSDKSLHETHTVQMVIRPEDYGRSWNPETNQMTYGLAWTLQDYRGLHLVSHGGAIDGFRANITLVPKERLGVAVMANLGQENMPEALRYRLIDILLGLEPRDWDAALIDRGRKEREEAEAAQKAFDKSRKNAKASLEPSQYAGVYSHPAYGELRVMNEGTLLTAQWGGTTYRLDHFHYDTFLFRGDRLDSTPLTFQLNPQGAVDTVKAFGVEFRRKN